MTGYPVIYQQADSVFETVRQQTRQAELDIVIPFTTPDLTRAAVHAAGELSHGLAAKIRLVKVQVVPFPADLDQPTPVLEFIKEQLSHFKSPLPIEIEIRLARDLEPALCQALNSESLVLLATRRRPWKTRTERLATSLEKRGHHVLLISENTNA
jgi:hypothetical protein